MNILLSAILCLVLLFTGLIYYTLESEKNILKEKLNNSTAEIENLKGEIERLKNCSNQNYLVELLYLNEKYFTEVSDISNYIANAENYIYYGYYKDAMEASLNAKDKIQDCMRILDDMLRILEERKKCINENLMSSVNKYKEGLLLSKEILEKFDKYSGKLYKISRYYSLGEDEKAESEVEKAKQIVHEISNLTEKVIEIRGEFFKEVENSGVLR